MKCTNNRYTQKKVISVFAGVLALAFAISGCSSGGDTPAATTPPSSTTATVSGTVKNLSNVGEPGVAVEAVYTTPGDAGNVTTTTDTNGAFSLTVEKNRSVYVHTSKSGFVNENSEKGTLDADETGHEIEIPTPAEMQAAITAAFEASGQIPTVVNHAWLIVEIKDANDNEVGNAGISSVPTPAGEVYVDCDGTDSLGLATIACPGGRVSTMYIAYFDATADVSVQAVGDTKTAPVIMGELTVLEFVQ